jgi:hypothetical protein
MRLIFHYQKFHTVSDFSHYFSISTIAEFHIEITSELLQRCLFAWN